MKTWTPLLITFVITVVMNAIPVFMAFVVGDEGWAQAGWAFYFFTIPLGALLLVLGLVLSLVLFFNRRKA
jgi:NADH:ubiquinone oxidoreductase subunit K